MNSFNESRTQTNAEHYIFATGTYKLLAFTIGTIGVLGFCNNVVVVILCYKFKRLRTPTNLLLLNISASDLLVSVIGTGFTLVSCVKQEWVWNTATCVWDGFSNSLFGIVSIMTLASLAYERYIRVVHAKVVDFPWAWRAITHIWLYSLAWVGAPLLGWNRYTLEIHQLGCSLDWASKDPNDASFIIFFLLGCFFVPTGIMAYCYGNILYAVHMLRSIEDLQTMQIIKALRYEKKVAAMFLLMILCYLLCWTPYTVVSMLEAFGKRKVVSPAAAIISSFFAKSSMMYNPVIYALMSRKVLIIFNTCMLTVLDTAELLEFSDFRRCMMQLLCSRPGHLQRSIKDRPLTCSDQPIRPIVMSQSRDNRPKKRVTFSSSSIVFIITSNDTDNQDVSKCNPTPEINIIQVRPL